MNNSYYNVSHSRDYYKGKSVEFAGEWTPGVRYFNDEYLNSLVVYTEKDTTGNIIHSALLACKKTHIAAYSSSISDSTNNQPHLIINNDLGIVGIEPNDYWIFVSGSLMGTPGTTGKSTEVVNTYLEAVALANENNISKIVFVKEEKNIYIITGVGELKKVISTSDLLELAESKVDKELGKGLSTNDFSNTEKAKLKGIAENAQRNVIEEVDLNGVKINPIDKKVSINTVGSINDQTGDITLRDNSENAWDVNLHMEDHQIQGKIVTPKSVGSATTPVYFNENGEVTPINIDNEVTKNSTKLVTSKAIYEKLELKQDQLIPGDNITIQDNVISAAGNVDLSGYAKTEDVNEKLNTKQDTLIPGNGINIEDNKIDVTVITESETQPGTSIWVNPSENTEVGLTYNRSQIDALVGSKQDVIDDIDDIRRGATKGATSLQSETDPIYTADKPNLALKSEIPDISGKVDKEEGKGLSSNDYTDEEKIKLAGLKNYDDTRVKELINKKANDNDLAKVAKTGKYSDLVDEPIVQSSQAPISDKPLWINPDEDVEEVEVYNRSQVDALMDTKQDTLQLTVKDNGNIVLSNIQGQTKEFMPATPSGDPMHYAYEAAGAEWNGTGADIIKTAPWADLADDDADKTVVHKAGYWYLNGLGDITNKQMRIIFIETNNFMEDISQSAAARYCSLISRTHINSPIYHITTTRLRVDYVDFVRNSGNLESIIFPVYKQSIDYCFRPKKITTAFSYCPNLKYIYGIINLYDCIEQTNAFYHSPNIRIFQLNKLRLNLDINNLDSVSSKSILYMIQNEAATSAITITLHADAYARAMANADIVTALEAHPNVSLASA